MGNSSLESSLERAYSAALDLAQHSREQRDEYTAKIRFGLVGFNAVSMITVLSLGGPMAGLSAGSILTSAGFFLAGLILGGYSLFTHQVHLIELAGSTASYASLRSDAIVVAQLPKTPENIERMDTIFVSLRDHASKIYSYSDGAISLQAWSSGLWIGGVSMIAGSKILTMLPSWLEIRTSLTCFA